MNERMGFTVKEVLEYLKECGTFYLATTEGDQPRTRPFGVVCAFEEKLYIATNNQKSVFDQMIKNPKVEICAMNQGTWIRVEGYAVHDDRREARSAMLEDNTNLCSFYSVDDKLFEVLYLKDATATIYSFTEEPKVISF